MDTIQEHPGKTFGVKGARPRRRFWAWNRSAERSSRPVTTPRGKPFARKADWHTVALVGASLAAGVALGAGVALLMAPQSGAHTRLALSRQLRRRRPWRSSPWEQLGEELKKAAHRRNRRIEARFAEDL
jgi:hypothetical protein